MLPATQREEFKRILETRISELDHALAVAEREAREGATKPADAADQAASEYERQSLVHKAADAEKPHQRFGADAAGDFRRAECGGDIEVKRLEAIPWARYCVKCQEVLERS